MTALGELTSDRLVWLTPRLAPVVRGGLVPTAEESTALQSFATRRCLSMPWVMAWAAEILRLVPPGHGRSRMQRFEVVTLRGLK